jgi:protein subunit release factor B
MQKFPVSPKKIQELESWMNRFGVLEKNIKEKFVRSSGPGGRKVDTSSTCVFLNYLPLNIQIKCQKERSLGLNRFFARRILMEEVERRVLGKQSKGAKRIEKLRKQKIRRKKRAKKKLFTSP